MKEKQNEKMHYIALDSSDNKTIVAEGDSIKELMEQTKSMGKDCIITPDLKENITYIF